ncbi:hypothetical protein DFH07DRAFT_782292 [Mycena maculata]|uniref:Uncharacterized protein n=1 Tax=Mycena maculata TaxID=230809 RepID=A0AAD7HTR9_9AGAR|nr:hypothetical protein DFH07DRAFT_782292 [Mycena maculata]
MAGKMAEIKAKTQWRHHGKERAALRRSLTVPSIKITALTTSQNWDAVLKLTGRWGVNRVIEIVGNSTLSRSIAWVKINRNINIIGGLGGVPMLPRILSGYPSRTGSKSEGYMWAPWPAADMNWLMDTNIEKTRPVIDKVFGFDDAKDVFAHFAVGLMC